MFLVKMHHVSLFVSNAFMYTGFYLDLLSNGLLFSSFSYFVVITVEPIKAKRSNRESPNFDFKNECPLLGIISKSFCEEADISKRGRR